MQQMNDFYLFIFTLVIIEVNPVETIWRIKTAILVAWFKQNTPV